MAKPMMKKIVLLVVLALVLIGSTVTILLLTKPKTQEGLAPNGSVIPTLSNPNAVFFQSEFFNLTYKDLYEEFKSNDGVNQLLFLIDQELLKDRISAVSSEAIANRILVLKYGTSDQVEIDELSAEDKETLDVNFEENMFLLGYSQDVEVYVRMLIAKEQLATEMMLDVANKEKTWYISDQILANDYTSGIYEDIQAIKIRFLSSNDARQIMRQFNLVSYQNDLRLYIGTRPLEEVSSTGLNDTNTRVLTSDEVLLYFIQMYNVVYGSYRDTLPLNATYEDIKNNPDFTQTFTQTKAIQTNLANYLFNILSSQENPIVNRPYYSYQPMPYSGSNDTAHYLILKVTGNDRVSLANFNPATQNLATLIGQETYDQLKQTKIDQYLKTTNFVAERMNEYRASQGLMIYDYFLGMDYKGIYAEYEVNNDGSETLVAKLENGFTVSADQLLTHAIAKNGTLYSVYAAQYAAMVSRHFQTVYCQTITPCETSLANSTLQGIKDHYTELEELKKSYQESYYAIYYSFAEYVYLAYGAKSDEDVIKSYFVKSKLQPHVIYEAIAANNYDIISELLLPIVEEYYDNYFSLNARTLLIYVDRNEDGSPDNYETFLESVTDRPAYDQKLADFIAAIRLYLTENPQNGFDHVVAAYNTARRNDTTWGEFKQYGFGLNLGNPSSSGSITYLSTKDQFEEALVEAFQATYNQYLLPANINKTGVYYDGVAETTAGIYLVFAQKGSNFTKPSAKFTMTFTNEVPNYTVGSANDQDLPSFDQLRLYTQKRFYEIAYGTNTDVETKYGITVPVLPTSLIQAMDAFFAPIHDSLYVVGHLNLRVSQLLQDGTYLNTTTTYGTIQDAMMKDNLTRIYEIFEKQVFAKFNQNQADE